MRSPSKDFQTIGFWNWSLFPLCSWSLESPAHCEDLSKGLATLGKLKALVCIPLNKSYPFSSTIFHSYIVETLLVSRYGLAQETICPPFSPLVLVMAVCLAWFSHKPETVARTHTYQGLGHPVFLETIYNTCSLEINCTTVSYSPALVNALGKFLWRPKAHTFVLKTSLYKLIQPFGLSIYVIVMVWVSFVERSTKVIYVTIFNIILIWTFCSYIQRPK